MVRRTVQGSSGRHRTVDLFMYTIIVESSFCAVHHVRLPDGSPERPHGHDWAVRAFFSRPTLDHADMVIDFERARGVLDRVLAGWCHAVLNDLAEFAGVNPTAEAVARKVFDKVRAAGIASVRRVEVTEAPGCVAIFESSEPRGAER